MPSQPGKSHRYNMSVGEAKYLPFVRVRLVCLKPENHHYGGGFRSHPTYNAYLSYMGNMRSLCVPGKASLRFPAILSLAGAGMKTKAS